MNAWLNYVGCGCVALSVLACGAKGSDGDDDDETGGTSGTGTGGSSGTATGGSSGTTTGGSSGTTTGGSSGSGGAPSMMTYDFAEPDSVCPDPPGVNMEGCWKLVNSNADTAVSTAIPADQIHYQHITDDGDPEMGAFEGTIPYDQPSQWVSFGINTASQNLTGATISARVKVVSGLGDPMDLTMNPGGSKVYAKSGMTYCYANGAYFNQGDPMHPIGEWQTITFNLAAPDYLDPMCVTRGEPFNPADIREIGIQFDSNPNIVPLEAVVVIDTVTY